MCLSILHLLLISFWTEFKNIMIWHHLLRFNWVFNLNRNIDNYFIIQWPALAKTCNTKIYSFFQKWFGRENKKSSPVLHLNNYGKNDYSKAWKNGTNSPLIQFGNLLCSGLPAYLDGESPLLRTFFLYPSPQLLILRKIFLEQG